MKRVIIQIKSSDKSMVKDKDFRKSQTSQQSRSMSRKYSREPSWAYSSDEIRSESGADIKEDIIKHLKNLDLGSTPKLKSLKMFRCNAGTFDTLESVSKAIKESGVDDCGLIFGIDFTLSNQMQGQQTFGGKSLHDISGEVNPYQEVICILGETLEPLDDDGIIPAYGFGDRVVKDKGIFPLKKEGECDGFSEVLEVYTDIVPQVKLGGPTNFAPLIREAVSIVKRTRQYHILVIVADGQVTSEDETVEAIVSASEYPLSIIVIGVGDGPWGVMREFDEHLPERKFDNFNFVEFHTVKEGARNPQAAIALAALMEIPEQYESIKRLRLLEKLKG